TLYRERPVRPGETGQSGEPPEGSGSGSVRRPGPPGPNRRDPALHGARYDPGREWNALWLRLHRLGGAGRGGLRRAGEAGGGGEGRPPDGLLAAVERTVREHAPGAGTPEDRRSHHDLPDL